MKVVLDCNVLFVSISRFSAHHFKILSDIPFPKVNVISADDFIETLTGKRLPKRS